VQEFINTEQFKTVCHHDVELAESLLAQMEVALNDQVIELDLAIQSHDQQSCSAVAHRILGVARYLCCTRLVQCAIEVESDDIASEEQLSELYQLAKKTLSFLQSPTTKQNIAELFKQTSD